MHGLGSSGLVFARAVATLSTRHRVIVPDLPGFGDSAKPFYDFSIPFYAETLVRFLEHLGVERCPWVGHSMGAQIALAAALDHPAHVESLVLVSPAGIETFSFSQRRVLELTVTPAFVRKQLPHQIRDAMALAFHRMPSEAERLIARRTQMMGAELEGYAHAFSAGVRAMLATPVRRRLRDVAHRCVILMGDDDRLVPNRVFHPAQSPEQLMRAAAPDLRAEVVMFQRTGHLLPFERPGRFAGEVLAFTKATAAVNRHPVS